MPLEEIKRLENLQGAEINDAKIILANEATKICRGLDAQIAAEKTAKETFIQGGAGADLPTVNISEGELSAGVNIMDLYIQTGLGKSKGEVRRLIQQGGAKLNDQKVDDIEMSVTLDQMQDGQIKLSAGKKRHALIKPIS